MSILSAGKGHTKYNIHLSNKKISKNILNKFLSNKNKVLIITDSGVPKKFLRSLKKDINTKYQYSMILEKGEKSKSFKTYQYILNRLAELKFDRTDYLIALGGGVVGDITGFAASTYLRGIGYIQIPTTLLSQVDSSVGGKTAINIQQGKNLVGAFYNPKLVKYSLIGNKKLKKIIEDHSQLIVEKDELILKKIIEESIKTKSKIVTKDEKESGIRAILNFGHTFGHAIEAYNNYKNITHGAAITLGMVIASKLSFYEGHIKDYQLDNIINMIESLGLNTDHSKYSYSKLKKYMASDKKVKDGKLNLILIDKKFNAFKTSKYNIKNITNALN